MPRTATIVLPQLKMCSNPDCGNIATGSTGFCFDHTPRRSLRSYTASPKPRANVKNPMGIEIECYNPDTVYKVTHVSTYVCSDGSLPRNGGEIKLCGPESKMEDQAADVVQRSAIAGNAVNKSCGLHLHFQLPQVYYDRGEGYKRTFHLTQAMQDFLFDIVPRSRRNNGYCTKTSSERSVTSHYNWFSMSNHVPTYEIRLHAGTMNAWKIKGWINAWTQVRPEIHKVIAGEDGWENIVDSFRGDGFMNKLNPRSIGYKYIKARSVNGGTLRNFGFNTVNR